MEHAWLVVSRYRVDATEIHKMTLNDEVFEVDKANAAQKRTELQKRADEENTRTQERVAKLRHEWLSANTQLRSSVPEGVKVGSFKRETRYFDELTIEGVVRRVEAGEGEMFLKEEAERRFPLLLVNVKDKVTFVPEKRTWKSVLFTATETIKIPTPEDLSWPDGAPVTWIAEQLDALSKKGWIIIHTSEDHGLYKGADASDESYPTRMRFLLQRSREVDGERPSAAAS